MSHFRYQILIFLIAMTFIPSCSTEKNHHYNPTAEFDAHVVKMPEPVWRLFYAIKHDLDYGVIGNDPVSSPLKNISDYKSVSTELLKSVETSFIIFDYKVEGMDYRLELRSINNKMERYLATRTETFTWKSGSWVSLGGYVYL